MQWRLNQIGRGDVAHEFEGKHLRGGDGDVQTDRQRQRGCVGQYVSGWTSVGDSAASVGAGVSVAV